MDNRSDKRHVAAIKLAAPTLNNFITVSFVIVNIGKL